MSATSIEWTEHSVNPIRARSPKRKNVTGHYCEKVSPGCKNCYSSRSQPRYGLPVFQEQRGTRPELFLDPRRLEEVLRRRKPTKWFWCDMTDLFGSWVPFEWIAACFGAMAVTPHHTHQVLTKRPERAFEFYSWLEEQAYFHEGHWTACLRQMIDVLGDERLVQRIKEDGTARPRDKEPWPLPNVHLGVSVENQKTADERVPRLLMCPAAIRWVSAEPLLEGIEPGCLRDGSWFDQEGADFYDALRGTAYWANGDLGLSGGPRLDWVVVGGESGPGARLFDVANGRALVEQCRAAGVPVFFKQAGSNAIDSDYGLAPLHLKARKGGDLDELPEDVRVREFPRYA